MSLRGKTKTGSYVDLLQMNNSNSGVDTNARTVVDGGGNASALKLSDDEVAIIPENDDTTSTFLVYSKDNQRLLRVDSKKHNNTLPASTSAVPIVQSFK